MNALTRRLLALGLFFSAAFVVAQEDSPEVRGKVVFDNYCIHCHGTGTHNNGATVRLEERYSGAVPGALESRTNLTYEFVETFVRGEPGMAPYRPTEITDADLVDLVAYLTRNNP